MATKKEKVRIATYLAEGLTGENATYKSAKGYSLPKIAVEVGRIEEIVYSVVEDGERIFFKHTWENKKPILATGHDGKGLFFLGGKQIVSDRGIED